MALTGASTGVKRGTKCCSPLVLQTVGRLHGTLEGREFQLCVWSFLCMSRLRLECQCICSWDSPCKTSFLPLAMLALGQRLEALVVCSSSPGPNLPYHWALSLLHTICWHVQWKISISEKAVPLSNTPHQVMSTSGCLSTMALDETELWGRSAVAFAQR